ncbi:hypothetical protein [Rhodoblastus sp.]|uniref:hypothetical protein n=1 Tax=Rhodoblastus sp. TaxID=1962975 RepID=UPI003F978D3D
MELFELTVRILLSVATHNKNRKKIDLYRLSDIAMRVELAYLKDHGLYTNAPCNVFAALAACAGQT